MYYYNIFCIIKASIKRGAFMENLEPKKLSLIRILQILQKYTDENHPLKHDEIVSILKNDYCMNVERKIIGRNISFLNESGFDIITTKKGSYLAERTFEDSELRLLIDGVLSSRYISPKHSGDLIEKLCGLSNKYFKKRIKNIYSIGEWDKTDNNQVFLNIDLIDEAIDVKKQIAFDYVKIGTDLKAHIKSSHRVSPYQMLLHNQRYYLMAYQEKFKGMRFYRIDKIINLNITNDKATDIQKIDGYHNGIDYNELSTAKPYMFTDKSEFITIRCEEWLIDEIADWFGRKIKIEPISANQINVTVRSSPNAMVYWAMQYGDDCETIAPESVRCRIKEKLEIAYKKYKE